MTRMTAEQIDEALAGLLRLGLVERVRDGEGVERYSAVGAFHPDADSLQNQVPAHQFAHGGAKRSA